MEDPYRRIGIVFWVQRRRYWNPQRIGRVLAGVDPVPAPEGLRGLEGGLRCLVFRMRKPRNWDERLRYGLDRQGNFRPGLYPACRRASRNAQGKSQRTA